MGDPGQLQEHFGLRKNPGRAILPAEKLGRALFGLRKRPCACAHSGNLTHRLCVLIHRKSSEEQFCEARIPQWVGPRTWNREAAGSIPGSPKVISGSLFRQSWDVLGCVWEWFRDVFGWVWDGFGKNVGRGRKMKISKNGREYFSGVGALKIHIFRLSPASF